MRKPELDLRQEGAGLRQADERRRFFSRLPLIDRQASRLSSAEAHGAVSHLLPRPMGSEVVERTEFGNVVFAFVPSLGEVVFAHPVEVARRKGLECRRRARLLSTGRHRTFSRRSGTTPARNTMSALSIRHEFSDRTCKHGSQEAC